MEIQTFFWVVTIGVGLIFLQLASVVSELRDLSHKIEFWGKYFSQEVGKLQHLGVARTVDLGELKIQVNEISARTRAHFPSEKEQEREAERQRYGL